MFSSFERTSGSPLQTAVLRKAKFSGKDGTDGAGGRSVKSTQGAKLKQHKKTAHPVARALQKPAGSAFQPTFRGNVAYVSSRAAYPSPQGGIPIARPARAGFA